MLSYSARTPRNRTRPTVELLEDRAVPATVMLSGSTLTISNARVFLSGGVYQTNLQVTQQADGRFLVLDNGSNNGTYAASSIVINGTNYADTIGVTVNSMNL